MDSLSRDNRRLSIRTNWDLKVIENVLKEHILACEIWGDLGISFDEYRNIFSKINAILSQSPSINGIRYLFRNFPVTMVTEIISFVLFEYDNNDFWNGWSSRYNLLLNTNNQTEIGKSVRDVFEKFEFDIIEDGGYTYVTPILCQAGIPCSCFNKIFDILDTTQNSLYFSARELVDELRGYRKYLIDAPVERFFRLHTERAIDLIDDLREMMHSIGGSTVLKSHSDPYFSGIESRIVKQYFEWQNENTSKSYYKNKKDQYYNSPKLVFDIGKGVCMFLPPQVIKQDIIYKLMWKISYTDNLCPTTVTSQVYNIEGRNCTNEIYVPVDISKEYIIELYDADDLSKTLTNSWSIEGICMDNPVIFFSESGIMQPQKYLSRKGTIIVFDSEQVSISDKKGIQELIYIDLPKSWQNICAFHLYPADKEAELILDICGEKVIVECKRNFDFEFANIGTLFGEKYSSKEIPIFVNFPYINIQGDIDNISKFDFDNWQVTIIHRLSNSKHTAMFSDLDVTFFQDHIRLSVKDFAANFYKDLYGPYEIKIYDGKARYGMLFNLLPYIDYSEFHYESYRIDISSTKGGFYFKTPEMIEVEFTNDVKVMSASTKGEGWNMAYTNSKRAYLHGQIVYMHAGSKYKVPFSKTIRSLEWQFWDESTNITGEYGPKLLYYNQIRNNNWRLILHFTNIIDKPLNGRLVLETATGELLQSKDIILDRDGNCVVPINLFMDTIGNNKLPQRLVLYVSYYDNEELAPIFLAAIKNFVELTNTKFAIKNEKPIIYWDKASDLSEKTLRLIPLSDPESDTLEYPLKKVQEFSGKQNRIFEGIILDTILKNGTYWVDIVEEEYNFFMDDNNLSTVLTYDKDRILCVNGKQFLESILIKKDLLLSDWLSACIVALYKKEWIEVIFRKMQSYIEMQTLDYDDKSTLLLFFLALSTNSKSNLDVDIKGTVNNICQYINIWCISDYDRIKILERLTKINLGDSDCIQIIDMFQLYLFKSNGETIFDRQSMQRLWEVNESLAVLANIRKCCSNLETDIYRVLNIINSDEFKKIITFCPTNECKTEGWQNCIENVLKGQCNCVMSNFEYSTRVWGDKREWNGLFANISSRYKLDLLSLEESDSNGYQILGSNYLTLIYNYIIKKSDEISVLEKNALQEEFKINNLLSKYNLLVDDIVNVLRQRTDYGTSDSHKLFFLVGSAAILEALGARGKIDLSDLREILPFFQYAIKAFPKLVYRDLIVAEISEMFRDVRCSC